MHPLADPIIRSLRPSETRVSYTSSDYGGRAAVNQSSRSEDQLAAAGTRPPLSRRVRRLRTAAIIAAVAAFFGALAMSTTGGQVPAGGTSNMSGMSGMQMDPEADHLGVVLRSVTGEEIAIPGGRPGVVLLMATSGCPRCAEAVAALAATAVGQASQPVVTVVSLDPIDTREDFSRFDRAAGRPDVEYALDDRGGSLARLFDADEYGTIIVYDRQGMVIGRLTVADPELRAELRRAFQR